MAYNLIIKRTTPANLWILVSNARSVKKVHSALLPFNGQFNRPIEAAIRTIVTKFAPYLHCWTLNHQHAYIECELKKILQLYRPVLMIIINYRFIAVRSKWALLLNNVENFCWRIKMWSLSKYSWCKNWIRTTYCNTEFLVNGLLESWPKIHFFIEKLCWATKFIFGSINT